MSTFDHQFIGNNLPYLVGGGVVFVAVMVFLKSTLKGNNMLDEVQRDTVLLLQMPRGPYAPSLSPFPIKLETYLRMTNIPYKNVSGIETAPNMKKTPWAQLNGHIFTDSLLLIENLNNYFKIDTMGHLSFFDRAIAHAFVKMLEENTYWCLVRWRWVLDPDKFAQKLFKIPNLAFWMRSRRLRGALYRKGIGQVNIGEMYSIFHRDMQALSTYLDKFAQKLFKIPNLAFWMRSRRLRGALYMKGIGQVNIGEMYSVFHRDMQALSTYLGEKRFFMGKEPCEVDCAIFGMLAQIKWHAPKSPLLKIMHDFPNLHAYCERMKKTYWPDWDECITHGGTKETTK